MTSPKKQKFTKEYAKCGNATKAARLAGYSEKTAKSAGNRLLKDKAVKKALKQAAEQSKKAAVWNMDHAIEELEEIKAVALTGDFPNTASAIKAIEVICKLKGLFAPEKQEIALEGGKHILTFKELCDNERGEQN